jgi:hypothetical protein
LRPSSIAHPPVRSCNGGHHGKIRLNLDDLQVESFESTPTLDVRGTVEGQELLDTASCGTLCERSHCVSGPCCSTGELI